MLLWTLAALGAGADDLDARTRAAVEKLKVRVDGSWSDGRSVVVDLTVPKFDRMLELNALSLDGPSDGRYLEGQCIGPEDTYAYCWVDEGRRTVRARFQSLSPVGSHTLNWFGVPVATFEVKPGGGAPAIPMPDLDQVDRFDFRHPESFAITGVSVFDDAVRTAEPGRQYLVIDASFDGAPASMLATAIRVSHGTFLEPAAAVECATKKGPLLTCDPMPEKGTIRLVHPVPVRSESLALLYGDDDLTTVEIPETLDDAALSEGLTEQLPEVLDGWPVTPLRVWTRDFGGPALWADFSVDGELDLGAYGDRLTPHGLDSGTALAYAMVSECYAEDPGAEPGTVPVPCDVGTTLRVAWRDPFAIPDAVQLASFYKPLGDPREVAADGPGFGPARMALALQDAGDFAGALPFLLQAVELQPNDVDLLLGIVEAYDQQSDPQAGAWAQRLLEHDSDYRVIAYDRVVMAALRVDDLDTALTWAERGLDEFAAEPTLQLRLGQVHAAKGEFAVAERLYLRADQRDSTGEAAALLGDVMESQNETSLATLARARSLLRDPFRADAVVLRMAFREALSQNQQWPGGSAVRGPLGAVAPMRVKRPSEEVLAAQAEYLILAWAKAAEQGANSPRLKGDPWYAQQAAVFQRLVDEDLVEAAAWLLISEPYQWPTRLNVKMERVLR